ncbi:5-hydroxytryptamine receptor 4-like [Saccoglossus kowalevskii]|uniref:5-hydroxytryptamine receptor 4-like n=1 Tax=Saccoglossus kowalevskii TaxID=10224 RepID=A0ABM0M6C9_SACKO|nr:PREDICTED: 5-hydroxytryptamine receptor 4-like [Saccoglossus kowalevskii]
MDVGDTNTESSLNITQPVGVTNQSANVTSAGVRSTFLFLFIVLSLIGNVSLIIAIASSDRLKHYVLNLFVLNISCALLCDTVLNMPLILGASIVGSWPIGEFMCQYNAFFLQLVDIAILLGLALVAVDRLVAARSPHIYPDQFSRLRTNLLICGTWILGVAFAFPLLVQAITSQYFNSRFLCSVANDTTFVYLVFVSLFCFILPIVFIFVAYIIIIRVGVKEKLRVRAMNTQMHYANDLFERPPLWEEMKSAKQAGIIQIAWCLLCGPYLLMAAIGQYENIPIIENSVNIDIDYSSGMQTAFVWMRLLFAVVFPFLTFVMRPEAWQDLKDVFTCNRDSTVAASPRNNTPVHIIQNKTVVHSVPTSAPPAESLPEKKQPLNNLGYQVPVLFATSNGLRLQIGNSFEENDVNSGDFFHADMFDTKSSSTTDFDSTMNSSNTAEFGLSGEVTHYHGNQNEKPNYNTYQQTKSAISKSEIKIERKTPTSPRKVRNKPSGI